MRSAIIALVTALLALAGSAYSQSLDTSGEEKACQEIGFKPKTTNFGECVLELLQRRRIALRSKKFSGEIPYRSSPARNNGGVWDMRLMVVSPNAATYLVRTDKTIYETVKIGDARAVVEVVDQIGSTANIKPIVYLRESGELNAGATFDNDGNPLIIINKPMYDLIANDRDMAAALIGHEIAHLYLRHPGATKVTDVVGKVIGLLAGIALEYYAQKKFGVADVGFDGGQLIGTAFSTSFTRDQEREADQLGIQWMKANGYNPAGAVRMFEKFEQMQGNNLLPFFQTHPNPGERIENARKEAYAR